MSNIIKKRKTHTETYINPDRQTRDLLVFHLRFKIFLWATFFFGGGGVAGRQVVARILEWVAIPFSKRSSQPRDWTWVSFAGRFFTIWAIYAQPVSHCWILRLFPSFFFFFYYKQHFSKKNKKSKILVAKYLLMYLVIFLG